MREDISENAPVEYFSALSDECRRAVVRILVEEDRPLDVSLLAGWIVGSEENAEQVEVKLHHIHLPQLEAAGLVSYSPEKNVAKPTEDTPKAYALLEAL